MSSRSEASRKAWLTRKRLAAARAERMRAFMETGAPVMDEDCTPQGALWGSRPVDPERNSIPAILARLRAAAREG